MDRSVLSALAASAALALGLAAPSPGHAQTWPDKPIRLIVGYPPGASNDSLARIVAERIGPVLGQNVVVDNRAGASGSIASELTAKAAPDGYTFQICNDATHSSNYSAVAKPPYDPAKDFTPLTLAALNPIVLVVNPAFTPVKTLAELVEYVKTHPDKGAYGSSGPGSPHHLAGEILKERSGVAAFVHVPYKGGGPAVLDLLGGQIPMAFSSLISVQQQIASGKLRALAITQDTRYDGLPDVPTMAETWPGAEISSWLCFAAPAGVPGPIAARLGGAIVDALKDPATKKKVEDSGMVVVASNPDVLAEQIRRDKAARAKLMRQAGIVPK
ncbi:MAG: Bug family tripartite tricarboxylate transporter substrate binding protein [Lautropia sp.]